MLQNDDDAPFNSIWSCIDEFSHSPLDDMLEKEDNVTLEQVLNEDTLIQEVKGSNSRVIEFLATEEHISKLLDYLTKNPEKPAEGASNEEQSTYELALYKYPYIVCELFCCDVQSINGVIKQHPELVAKFFDYLQNNTHEEAQLNPARSGYVLRAFGTFLDKHYILFANHLFQLDNELKEQGKDVFLELILNQIHLPDMESFLLRLLGFAVENHFEQDFGMSAFGVRQFRELLLETSPDQTEADEMKAKIQNWVVENEWIEKILAFLSRHPEDEFVQMNLFGALETIVEKGDNPISLHLLKDDVLSNFIQALLKNTDTPLFVHGIEFLAKIIEQIDVHYDSDQGEQELPTPIATIASHTQDFVKLLSATTSQDDSQKSIETPSGTIESVLGETRLCTLELLRILYKLKYPEMRRILIDAGVFSEVVRLFFAHDSNNIMHSNGYTIIYSVLSNFENPATLIKESGLVDKLMQAYKEHQQREKKNQKSSSIMGHVLNVTNNLVHVSQTNTELSNLLNETKGWDKFIRNYIAHRNEVVTTDLGGPRVNNSYSFDQTEPLTDSSSDEEDELSPQRPNQVFYQGDAERRQDTPREMPQNGSREEESNSGETSAPSGFDDDFDADFDAEFDE